MKVTKTTTSNSETSATIDLFEGLDLPKKVKEAIAEEVGQFIIEQTISDVTSQKSPVEGYGKFPALKSKEYKLKKKEEVGNQKADLQLSGETLDELDYKVTPEGLKVGVFGDRAPVADGHNNLSGKSELPLRRFIPDKGETYKADIAKEINRIVSDYLADNDVIEKKDLQGINSKSGLYNILGQRLGLASRSEIKLAVFRNDSLRNLLDEEDLLDML